MAFRDDEDMPDMEPIADLFRTFRQSLTADDIARIEEGMNLLVLHLFLFSGADEDTITDELSAPLVDKIEAYMGITDNLDKYPEIGLSPEQQQLLRERLHVLLRKVNGYYHKLN